jgi:hypothetical protein
MQPGMIRRGRMGSNTVQGLLEAGQESAIPIPNLSRNCYPEPQKRLQHERRS